MSGSFPDHLIASAIGADYSVSEYDSAEYPSGLRERIANPSVVGSNPTSAFGSGRASAASEPLSRHVRALLAGGDPRWISVHGSRNRDRRSSRELSAPGSGASSPGQV